MKIHLESNNQYFRLLELDDRMFNQLREWTRVKDPNAEYTEAYIKKRWDGYHYCMTLQGRVKIGLLRTFVKLIQKYDEPIEVLDERVNLIKDWQPHQEFQNISLYDYQFESVQKLNRPTLDLPYFNGICDNVTNAGKTYIFAGIFEAFNYPQTLLLVDSQLLFKQHLEFYTEIFHPKLVGRIDRQANIVGDKPFVIAMKKTLLNRIEKGNKQILGWLKGIQLLGVDECHKAAADDYMKLRSKIPAWSTVYMSGTPLEGKDRVKKLKLIGASGTIFSKIGYSDMVTEQKSLPVEVHLYPFVHTKFVWQTDWQTVESELITKHEQRNKALAKLVNDVYAEKQVFIPVTKKVQGMALQRLIKGSEFAASDDWNKQKKIDAFKAKESRVLITTEIIREGINIPCIEVIVYARGGRSVEALKQLSGRGQRLAEGIDKLIFVDLTDEGNDMVKRHSKVRQSIYKKEGYEVQEFLETVKV